MPQNIIYSKHLVNFFRENVNLEKHTFYFGCVFSKPCYVYNLIIISI